MPSVKKPSSPKNKKIRRLPNSAYRRGRILAAQREKIKFTFPSVFANKFVERLKILGKNYKKNSHINLDPVVVNSPHGPMAVLRLEYGQGSGAVTVATGDIWFKRSEHEVEAVFGEHQGLIEVKNEMNLIRQQTGRKWNELMADLVVSAAHASGANRLVFLDHNHNKYFENALLQRRHYEKTVKRYTALGRKLNGVILEDATVKSARDSMVGLYSSTLRYLRKNYPLKKRSYLTTTKKEINEYVLEFP